MNINRHNYEEYFLLYVDNELNIVQRRAVEAFVAENPDLKAELDILQESVLPADDSIVFGNKEALLRTAATPNPVNETNCEEYFVLYADDELTHEQKDLVEQFVYRYPQHQASFELMQQAKLMPDTSIVFPDKYALYRHEEDDRVPVVPIRWWKIAVAAAVLLLVGGGTWYTYNKGGATPASQGEMAVNNDTNSTKQPATQQPQEALAATQPNGTKEDQQAPAVAATDPQKQEATQQQAPAKTIVQPRKAYDIDVAVNKTQKEKNKEELRNIRTQPDVPHTEDTVKTINELLASNVVPDKMETTPKRTGINIPVKGPETTSTNNATVEYVSEPDVDNTYASTDDKKNKMRGFFRKVSRVFEKTANIDDNGNEKRAIRIASFEFALK